MAWCTHCLQDRPIQRQTFEGLCSFCGQLHTLPHHEDCRGPVPGALDVCTYCNTPLFARALDKGAYDVMASRESQIEIPDTSAWSILASHGITNVSPERANVIVDYIKSRNTLTAIKELRATNPAYDLSSAMNIVKAIGRDLGVEKSSGGCVVLLLFISYLIIASYLASKV
ncbi:MAG TPA: hypothetical protein VF543_03160 [Pyrinomonadaceae bacterium]